MSRTLLERKQWALKVSQRLTAGGRIEGPEVPEYSRENSGSSAT